MENLLLKAIMVSIFMWVTFFDKYITQFLTYRPIAVGPIVGAIMEDTNIRLQVGYTIELMFLGRVFVGTALPPEETSSAGIATAFAYISGNQQLALATALLLATLGQMGIYFRNIALCVWAQHRMEVTVERGSKIGIIMNAQVWPNIFNLILFVVPTFMAIYLRADAVQAIIDVVPKVIIDGLTAGGSMIGAAGLALLLQSISVKGTRYYFVIGFFLSSFLKIGNIGITLVAVVCAATAYYNDNKQEA